MVLFKCSFDEVDEISLLPAAKFTCFQSSKQKPEAIELFPIKLSFNTNKKVTLHFKQLQDVQAFLAFIYDFVKVVD